MTDKETIIKLFKLKITENDLAMGLCDGEFLYGCYFYSDCVRHFIGISKSSLTIYLDNLYLFLTSAQHLDVERIYDRLKEESETKKEEALKRRLDDGLRLLAEIASKENINTSRRVLTEKHTKDTNFKY